MKEKYVVGFDDTAAAHRAVEFALGRTRNTGGTIHLVYVLEWSPYSFLTNEEIAERKGRRKAELSRAEEILKPAAEKILSEGVDCETLVRFGNAAELLCQVAVEQDACEILVGRTGDSPFKGRLLGSLVVNLAQASPVPLTVVP